MTEKKKKTDKQTSVLGDKKCVTHFFFSLKK